MTTKAIDPPISVSVAPTTTVLATFDTTTTAVLSVEVETTDATQTCACTIQKRPSLSAAFVDSTLGDLGAVSLNAPGSVDIDCAGNSQIRIVGVASGAGMTVTICGRDRPRGR